MMLIKIFENNLFVVSDVFCEKRSNILFLYIKHPFALFACFSARSARNVHTIKHRHYVTSLSKRSLTNTVRQ